VILVGREEELHVLDDLLGRVREGLSGALVLSGEAGIGKTVLLNATANAAEDLLVIRLQGVESEMELGFAALHRLLIPFQSLLVDLPEPQRDALGSAFGMNSLPPADRFMVGLAALTVLGDAAKSKGLLIIVDDAQWLDHDSVAALVFVARRLFAESIALIFGVRTSSSEVQPSFQGIEELPIKGLEEAHARQLLASSFESNIQEEVASQIITATRGNPLALLELKHELTDEQLMNWNLLPDPLPTGQLAWEGDQKTRTKAQQLAEASLALGAGASYYVAYLALAHLELGEGRYEAALDAAQVVVNGGAPAWACQGLPLVIEAAARSGTPTWEPRH